MARLRPTKPTISLSLLLSEGVRIRTTISPFYPERPAQNSTGGPALLDARPDGPENACANSATRRPDSAAWRPEAEQTATSANRGRPPRKKPGSGGRQRAKP